MPFQINFSIKRVEALPVILLSAGEPQNVFCGAGVTLTAIVDEPDNLAGHAIEWEQIVGTPVALSTPYELTTTYPLAGLDNKVFRFWIDKGLVVAQYQDVKVNHTPETYVPFTSYDAKTPIVIRFVPSDSPVCESISLTAVPPPPLIQSTEVPILVDLVWDEPANVLYQPWITQYTVYENDIPVQTTLVNEPRVYALATTAVYKILTEFSVGGQYSSEFSCERDYLTELPLPSVRVIDDYVPSTSYDSMTPSVTIVKKGNIVNTDNDTDTPYSSYDSAMSALYVTKIANTRLAEDGESDTPYLSYDLTNYTSSITRSSSGGIGG